MMHEFPSVDDIKVYLPKYLSEDDQKKLFDQLKLFPANIDKRMYSNNFGTAEHLLQGDAVKDVKMPPQTTDDVFSDIKALLLSNSCDISTENKRIYDSYFTFAPIFSLAKYEQILKEDQHSDEQVKTHIDAIKDQKITPFFYLPADAGLGGDCFARFDCVFSVPSDEGLVQKFVDDRILSLSNYGFYLLLFKYSIHTNRIQEKVQRD